MLFTLAIILFVLWLLGVIGTYTIGGIVHVLLVVALVLFVLGALRFFASSDIDDGNVGNV